MHQQELDCINSTLLTLRLIGGYNEPSLEEYAPLLGFVPSVAPLCDSRSTVSESVENL